MKFELIGKHEKDSRACRDGLALTLNEMMAEDKLMTCILLPQRYPKPEWLPRYRDIPLHISRR